MSRSTAITQLLCRTGPLPAAELRALLDMPQATFQRHINSARDSVLVVGKARATTYAVRREVPQVPAPLPVYEVSPDGSSALVLTLHPVEPFGGWIESHSPDVKPGFWGTSRADTAHDADLPWFLRDLRPAGFLGRLWARTHREQGFSVDPRLWSADDVLRFMAWHGVDLPGALVVGTFARDRIHDEQRLVLPEQELDSALPRLADLATRDQWGGSSPGGEQPKVHVMTQDADGAVTTWIAKFTAPLGTPVADRWADLLMAEHLAHKALQTAGIPSCRSRVIDAGGRRFLLIARFDRRGLRGRSGAITLTPLDDDGVAGSLYTWRPVVARLAREGRLSADVLPTVAWIESFADLIANTDTHPGNLALNLRGTRIVGLAPVYDMLPMHFAPRVNGELIATPRPPSQEHSTEVRRAAAAFWETVAGDPRVSLVFGRVADAQHHLIRT